VRRARAIVASHVATVLMRFSTPVRNAICQPSPSVLMVRRPWSPARLAASDVQIAERLAVVFRLPFIHCL
jgi:hypothetical protein